jgi:sodium transport system permease protein
MRWSNVRVIFGRELRDQLRDRRTLFMVFVLPVLLYPILSLGLAQLLATFREKTRTVVVVGYEALPELEARGSEASGAEAPPLLDREQSTFNPGLFDEPGDAQRLRVELAPARPPWTDPEARRRLLREGAADAIVLVPPDLPETLRRFGRAKLDVVYNSADERSQITFLRVDRVVQRWSQQIVERRREQEGRPPGYTDPVTTEAQSVARPEEAGVSVWSKVFPFLLVLMALTGAFYPAVDLCAGEKERGTMETLLISPAGRAEIVVGKFLTVMFFSVATAALNLAAMGVTAFALSRQLGDLPTTPREGLLGVAGVLRAPSLASAAWMLLMLLPLSAFFSALCLALAVLARSMKEGQYYMTPLYLVAMPLILMTVVPGVELDLFTSLLPITGVSLLLRSLMQGDYEVARRYFLPVLIPILIYGLIALRWAVDQFKSESVLFREAERFDLRAWLRHLWRDKPAVPSPVQALLCFVLILVTTVLLMPALGGSLAAIAVHQVAIVLGIPLALTLLLTTDPARTLRLRLPRSIDLALGIALPIALFPMAGELRVLVETLFPPTDAVRAAMRSIQEQVPDLGTALLLFALVPAVCEEVAFRGYILSGLGRAYRPAWSVVLTALLFGFLHVLLSLFQQLFNATLMGLVLGLLALKSRSLMPCVVFHLLNNGLAVLAGTVAADPRGGALSRLLYRDPAHALFRPHWVALGSVVSVLLIVALMRLRPAPPGPGRGGREAAPGARVGGAPAREPVA